MQVSTKLSTTPLRGVFGGGGDEDKEDNKSSWCPDSRLPTGDSAQWEWFNTTTPRGQQLYVSDAHIRVKCLDQHHIG